MKKNKMKDIVKSMEVLPSPLLLLKRMDTHAHAHMNRTLETMPTL